MRAGSPDTHPLHDYVAKQLAECLAGNCRLFSVQNDQGKRVATLGIERKNGNWRVCGLRGFANQPVRDTLWGLEDEVVQRYADLWRLTESAENPLHGLSKTENR